MTAVEFDGKTDDPFRRAAEGEATFIITCRLTRLIVRVDRDRPAFDRSPRDRIKTVEFLTEDNPGDADRLRLFLSFVSLESFVSEFLDFFFESVAGAEGAFGVGAEGEFGVGVETGFADD